MPGAWVKNWDMYHALRKDGKTKEAAAKIANAYMRKKKRIKFHGKK